MSKKRNQDGKYIENITHGFWKPYESGKSK